MFRTVALCGGLTTFSRFSLDGYYLIERGQALASFAYTVTHLLSPAKSGTADCSLSCIRRWNPIDMSRRCFLAERRHSSR